MSEFPYQPYYCEENIWKLCERAPHGDGSLYAVFISNEVGATPLYDQRAAPAPAEPIFWDYHVVAVSRDDEDVRTWDLDSRLPVPVPFERWWNRTFPTVDRLRPIVRPSFRVVEADTFLDELSSDRSHMRDTEGEWLEPPPEWPPIWDAEQGMNLGRFIDMSDETYGSVLEARAFRDAALE